MLSLQTIFGLSITKSCGATQKEECPGATQKEECPVVNMVKCALNVVNGNCISITVINIISCNVPFKV